MVAVECFSAATSGTTKRNMFESAQYDKPVVILGMSGPGKELQRLASSVVGPKHKILSPGDVADYEASIASDDLEWGDVVVLDFANVDDPSLMEELAKSLYEEQELLVVFVNVHPTAGGMTSEASMRKDALERDVFIAHSDYELCLKDEGNEGNEEGWSHAQWELIRLLSRATLAPAVPGSSVPQENTASLTMGAHTFFLSLSFPSVSQAEPYVEEMCNDVDAMEYRTDLLNCRDDRFELLYGLQKLRKMCRPFAKRAPALPTPFGDVVTDSMPVCYTVRTAHQAGKWDDDDDGIIKMFQLLELGLRGGVEVLDVESAWDPAATDRLLSLAETRYASQILGSHHVVGSEVTTEEAVKLFQKCALNDRAHGAKVVLSILDESKDRMAYDAAAIASSLAQTSGKPVIPNVSLILGEKGQYSRILNVPFTPVTHECLPFAAAPGQLTSNEILTTRILTGVLQPKEYAILGYNIAYSVSPQMHGAAFAATKLPHEYYRADVADVEEFIEGKLWNSETFGGCSVTIPHKRAIMPYVDILSDAAKTIGSVNTIVIKERVGKEEMERVVFGDNTDWIGIRNPLKRRLGGSATSREDEKKKKVGCALILGAGGTARAAAYAACQLGLEPVYFNRTPEKATVLAETFTGTVVSGLGEEEAELGGHLREVNGEIKVVISTLPAAAKFTLPELLLPQKPIVFDVNYKPYNTDLLLQADGAGCSVVRGSEMLWEQGTGQFEAWTGRSAPYGVMRDVVLENCLPKEEIEKK